jgi:hypothetical protein
MVTSSKSFFPALALGKKTTACPDAETSTES